MPYDNILLAAFGGPTPGCCKGQSPCPGEAHCFVEGILGKDPKRAGRVKEVASHYREIGGFSPFNELTFRQAESLQKALAHRGLKLPVRAGMRHWSPWIKDVVAEIAKAGQKRTLAVILAPHQSAVSWDWYQKVVSEACAALGPSAPSVDYLDPWPTHPGFVKAVADGLKHSSKAALVFTAHAIPMAVADKAPYARQFQETAAAVARELSRTEYFCAYQSQASDTATSMAWTGPDVNDQIRDLAAKGAKSVVLSPIGFLCDHVEVLYDLDVAAKRTAAEAGVAFTRAPTVGSHPAFIGMLADLIAQKAAAGASV